MKIQFNTDNAAFEMYGDQEVRKILEEITSKVEHGYRNGLIIDINGNKIGTWSL